MEEALLELAGSRPAARIDFAAFFQPSLREAHDYPTEQAQGKGRRRVADPALIFAQSDIERVVETAFDNPVAPLELEKAGGVQLLQGQAADEIDDLRGLFAFAANAPSQPGPGLHAGEADLRWGGLAAIQDADFMPPPVGLLTQGVGARGRSRGKNAVRSTASRAW